jgi:hypothetical protein
MENHRYEIVTLGAKPIRVTNAIPFDDFIVLVPSLEILVRRVSEVCDLTASIRTTFNNQNELIWVIVWNTTTSMIRHLVAVKNRQNDYDCQYCHRTKGKQFEPE